MGEIFKYSQEKLGRKKDIISKCKLTLSLDSNILYYYADFNFINHKSGVPKIVYGLMINLKTGNFETLLYETTKNNFKILKLLSTNGFVDGIKKSGFWGMKYKDATDKIFKTIKDILISKTRNKFIKSKKYESSEISLLYELVTDFHLSKRKIKFHDNAYYHLLQVYPKTEFLKINDNKLLPAILDEHKIKSKFLVGKLSSDPYNNVNLHALKYLCHMFTNNYLDYIKKFDWVSISKTSFNPIKFHTCRNEYEKKIITNLIIDATVNNNKILSILETIYKILELNDFFISKNFDLKLKITNSNEIDKLLEEWTLLKKNVSKGHLLKHGIPDDIVTYIEEPISINGRIFQPKLLLTEVDYLLEGMRMKNCLGSQFKHGAVLYYISLSYRGKKIDLEFDKNVLKQQFAKANTPVKKELFDKPIKVLTDRLTNYKDLVWDTEKILF